MITVSTGGDCCSLNLEQLNIAILWVSTSLRVCDGKGMISDEERRMKGQV
jgi:hypothetical protein